MDAQQRYQFEVHGYLHVPGVLTPAEAARLCKLAAEQGLNDAQYILGCMYKNGQGVTRNIAEAARWYERAAAKGHEYAKKTLAKISSL